MKKNPFPFILREGDPLSILQILTAIDRLGIQLGLKNLTTIISLQNEDGGFPRDLQKSFPSSVKATYRVLNTLLKVGIDKRSHIVVSALDWLLNQQNSDGGWHENPAINLPDWMTWESTSKSVTWYTCQIGKLLQELQMQNIESFKKLIAFLESTELQTGGWSAVKGLNGPDPDSTVGIADFLAQVVGEHHPTLASARSIFNEGLAKLNQKIKSERVEDAYELTHLIFDKPENSMYKEGDQRVKTLLLHLVDVQMEDGGWLTFYSGGKSDVPITVYSLQVLMSHGIIDKPALRKMFDTATSKSKAGSWSGPF